MKTDFEIDQLPEQEHEAVLTYIAALAKALQKTAYITPENTDDTPMLSFDPEADQWIFNFSEHE